jgi:hypothetical protein
VRSRSGHDREAMEDIRDDATAAGSGRSLVAALAVCSFVAWGCGGTSSASPGMDAAVMVPLKEGGHENVAVDAEAGVSVDASDLDGAYVEAALLDGGVDGDASAGSLDSSPTICGDASCASGQLCAYQVGGPVQCSPLDDAGGCPSPTSYMQTCPSLGNGPGCYANPPPWPLGCVAIAAACGSSPSCQCQSPDPCPSTCPCDHVQGSSLLCGCP